MVKGGMTFFQGSEEYTIDNKGRVVIPPYMRRSLSPDARDTFTFTRGFRKFILAYPIDQWKKIQNKLMELNPFNFENDKIITFFTMFCKEVSLDAQNRLLIPKELLSYAEISTKVLIVGKVDHIEFWNPDEFAKVYSFEPDEYAKIFEKVLGAGYYLGSNLNGNESSS
ncbi:MAG: division/cell wall cluster transcriptional repressor MraZ [Ignavibacteria bacterium]|nr:division/cell wall cluster transcriptional repressor MraZ [Ignavibacteria bacterium]